MPLKVGRDRETRRHTNRERERDDAHIDIHIIIVVVKVVIVLHVCWVRMRKHCRPSCGMIQAGGSRGRVKGHWQHGIMVHAWSLEARQSRQIIGFILVTVHRHPGQLKLQWMRRVLKASQPTAPRPHNQTLANVCLYIFMHLHIIVTVFNGRCQLFLSWFDSRHMCELSLAGWPSQVSTILFRALTQWLKASLLAQMLWLLIIGETEEH